MVEGPKVFVGERGAVVDGEVFEVGGAVGDDGHEIVGDGCLAGEDHGAPCVGVLDVYWGWFEDGVDKGGQSAFGVFGVRVVGVDEVEVDVFELSLSEISDGAVVDECTPCLVIDEGVAATLGAELSAGLGFARGGAAGCVAGLVAGLVGAGRGRHLMWTWVM